MYINGEWVPSEGGKTFNVYSPVTGEHLATLPSGSPEDVKKAVECAVDAQETIARMPIAERTDFALKIAEAIKAHADDYARDLTLEHGKPIRESLPEVLDSAPNVLWQAEDLKRLEAPVLQSFSKPDMKYILQREPLGTVAVITPWNFPWVMPAEFAVQAMLAGNSVLFKPASTTPISAVHLMECVHKAGVPKGLINLVTGPGSTTGMALIEHPLVDGICFTGDTATGEVISKRAGLKKMTLELGGLGPLIIMDDANIEKAVEDIAYGCYTNGGQCCCANERILVHEKIHRQVVDLLVKRVARMKMGDPLREETDMGPMNNEPTLAKVEDNVQDAISKGAKLLAGGKRAEGFPTKLYYPPTVVDNVRRDMKFNYVETFGPVAPVIEFSNLDEGIEIANEPRYGLSMAIHTKNLKTALYAAQRLKAGQVNINESVYFWDYHHPWGGFRRSGYGRVAGRWTLEAFTELKTININIGRSEF
jgi:acyl-CoA reductase-like NAD-dependent aldehyde dehydrogenase